MLRFRSIVARILWLQVIVVCGVAVLMTLSLYWLLDAETNNIHRDAMREQADRIASHLSLDDGGWHLDLPEELRDLYSEAYGRYVYAIVDQKGDALFSSHNVKTAIFPGIGRSDEPEFLQVKLGHILISGTRIAKTIGSRTVWIEVAENLSHRDVLIDDIVASFVPRVAWITVPILLVLLAVDAWIVRQAFKPVRAASRLASEIGPKRTDIRLSLQDIPSEIAPLVFAINDALERLERGFQMQREFTADAAHELRTPMAILRARIDTLVDYKIAESLRHDVDSMTRIISQLLEMAEIETLILGVDECADLHAVATDVIAFIAPIALANNKNIALLGAEEPVWVSGNGEMIARALRNVIENAIKHTAPGTLVEVEVYPEGIVQVRDRGMGINEPDSDLMFHRFWRQDRKHSGGVGLGLAIVHHIMGIHGGKVEAANRSIGGAQFTLTFCKAKR